MAILNTAGNLVGHADLKREGPMVVAMAQYAEEGVSLAELTEALASAAVALGRHVAVAGSALP